MKYRVRYRLSNDREMVVDAKDMVGAKEVAIDKFDPDNQYDWTNIISIEKVSKEETNGR